MQSPLRNTFYQDSPRRILRKAQIVARDIEQHTELQQANKISQLKELVDRRKQDVRMAIDTNCHQNDIFRKLEQEDQQRRRSILNKIEQKFNKISNLRHENIKQRSMDLHKFNEKVDKKLQKHNNDISRFEEKCQEKAGEYTKQMLGFHKKQMDEMKREWKRLASLNTQYTKAEKAISAREKKKEDFAIKTENELVQSLKKNVKKENPEQVQSVRLRHKRVHKQLIQMSDAFKTSNDCYTQRIDHYMQKYCSDLDAANQMQNKKEQEFRKTTDRVNSFFNKRVEKWSKLKKRVDQESNVVADRCTHRMNKSMNNSFRGTSSDFHNTCNSWRSRNHNNKHQLREKQLERDERIILKHMDSSRKNRDEDSLNNTMTDMMMRASFHAREFL